MASWTTYFSDNRYYLTFTITSTQDVADNRSTLTWDLKFTYNGTAQGAYNNDGSPWDVTIDGTVYSGSKVMNFNVAPYAKTHTVSSGTHIVNHAADGTKTVSLKWHVRQGAAKGDATGTQSWVLPTIPRASQPRLSASTFTTGSTITIYSDRASTAFTHSITYSFGSASGTIAPTTAKIGASTTWTVPHSLANAIPNGTQGTGAITMVTWNGSTQIGTKSINFTANLATSIVPSASIAWSPTDTAVTNRFGKPVQNISALNVVISATGAYSSTIKSYVVKFAGQTYNTQVITTNKITLSGIQNITAEVTDSRGRKASAPVVAVDVMEYANPSIEHFAVERYNDGVQDTYMSVALKSAITSGGYLIDPWTRIQWRPQGTETWTTVWSDSTNFVIDTTTNALIIGGADVNTSYEVRCLASDWFTDHGYNYAAVMTATLNTSFTLLDFYSGGRGIGFGKVAEDEGIDFNTDLPLKYNGATVKWPDEDAETLVGMSPTNLAAGNTIMARDLNGRSYIANPTLAGHIANKQYVDSKDNTSATGYNKMSDGTLICWGEHIDTHGLGYGSTLGTGWSRSRSINVSLPVNMINTGYIVTLTHRWVNDANDYFNVFPTLYEKTTSTFNYVLNGPATSGSVRAHTQWIAIGRWK